MDDERHAAGQQDDATAPMSSEQVLGTLVSEGHILRMGYLEATEQCPRPVAAAWKADVIHA